MLDDSDKQFIERLIQRSLSSAGFPAKETKKPAPKKNVEGKILTRRITEESVPECYKAYTLLFNEALYMIDYFWLLEPHKNITIINGTTRIDIGGDLPTLEYVMSCIFGAGVFNYDGIFSNDKYLHNGEEPNNKNEASFPDLKWYRVKRILSDAVKAGCFPKDVKLIQGVGFVLEGCYKVTPDAYHAERQRRMHVAH